MRPHKTVILNNKSKIPLRVGTVHNRANSGTTSSTGNNTMCFRWQHCVGQDLSDIVISMKGWYIGISTISNIGNDYSIVDMALESDATGLTTPITFSGGRTITVTNGSVEVQSDAIPARALGLAKFSRGEIYYIRGKVQVASTGQSLPVTTAGNRGGLDQANWYNPSNTTVSTTDASGNYTQSGTSWVAQTSGLRPIVLGHPLVDGKSFIGVGDSILSGNGDSGTGVNTVAGNGFMQRAMHDALASTTNPIPCLNFGVPSTNSTALSSTTQWINYLKYAKYGLDEYGTNDLVNLSAGQPGALETSVGTIWAAMRKNGIKKIIRTDILCRTNSNYEAGAMAITSGGSGYATSSTFNVTLVGGTLAAGGSATVLAVTTNSSGVVTSINPTPVTPGLYSTFPSGTISTTGGAGSGLTVNAPFLTGEGGWFDTTNQSPINSNFAASGWSDQFNTYCANLVGSTLDAVTTSSTVRDGTTPELWAANGTINYPTSDGTHPTGVNHELKAVELRSIIAASFP